jgi:hypothetical protein
MMYVKVFAPFFFLAVGNEELLFDVEIDPEFDLPVKGPDGGPLMSETPEQCKARHSPLETIAQSFKQNQM